MRALGVVLAIVAASSFASAPARADDESTSTELFNAGRDLLKRGDYAAACPMLAESVRLKATVGALAKLATCEEHEHRLVSAYTRWQQALNVARATGDDRADDIGRELARIDRVIPKLNVTAGGALPADAVVRIDDTTFGPAGLGVPHAVEAGAHAITVTAAHKIAWSTTVTTAADGATTAVSIPPLDDAPVAPPLPPPPISPAPLPSLDHPHHPPRSRRRRLRGPRLASWWGRRGWLRSRWGASSASSRSESAMMRTASGPCVQTRPRPPPSRARRAQLRGRRGSSSEAARSRRVGRSSGSRRTTARTAL